MQGTNDEDVLFSTITEPSDIPSDEVKQLLDQARQQWEQSDHPGWSLAPAQQQHSAKAAQASHICCLSVTLSATPALCLSTGRSDLIADAQCTSEVCAQVVASAAASAQVEHRSYAPYTARKVCMHQPDGSYPGWSLAFALKSSQQKKRRQASVASTYSLTDKVLKMITLDVAASIQDLHDT